MESPSKAEILTALKVMMTDLFELDSDKVQPEARLIEDLELDSLDAIDLAVRLEETTGLVLDEAKLRELRTVEDILAAIALLAKSRGVTSLRSYSAAAQSES